MGKRIEYNDSSCVCVFVLTVTQKLAATFNRVGLTTVKSIAHCLIVTFSAATNDSV